MINNLVLFFCLMKKKRPLDQEIYLPEQLSGTVARSFEKEADQRILYWDFRKALDEKFKTQTELLLNVNSGTMVLIRFALSLEKLSYMTGIM